MPPQKANPQIKKPYCETCKNIARIRGRWTQLHCRDCRYPGRQFDKYLIIRLMHHYADLEDRMLQLHKQHTTLYAMYEEAIKQLVSKDGLASPEECVTLGKPQAG